MTHYEKLDLVLNGLLYSQIQQKDNTILTFEFFCSTLLKNEDVTKWESDFIQNRLISDGYIKLIEKKNVTIPEITPKGIKFIQDGGYEKEQDRKDLQEELVRTTIKCNKRSIFAFWISVAALIVSVASIIIGKI